MHHYEGLVNDIQLEANKFREENRELKESLAAIIDDNNRLRALQSNKHDESIGAFRNDYIDVSNRIFNNLRNQLVLINQVQFFCRSIVCHCH